MTASVASISRRAVRPSTLPGLRALVQKDLREWAHGPRAAVVLIVTALFMTLAAANMWINAWIIANVPDAASAGSSKAIVLDPLANVGVAVGSQIFLFAAIFAAMSLIVRERESGTLAWVASKPVSRTAIVVAKWLSASLVLWIVAGLVPLALTSIVVTVLYGAPPLVPVVAVGLGIGAAIALFVAIALTASTFVASQPAVAGIAFAAVFLPTIVNALIPFDIAPFEPTSILPWAVGLAGGASVGVVTPAAWLLGLVGLAAIASRRMDRLEL